MRLNARDGLHAEGPSAQMWSERAFLQGPREEGVGVASPGAPGWASETYLNKPLDSGRGHQESVGGPTPSCRPLTPDSPQRAGNGPRGGQRGRRD